MQYEIVWLVCYSEAVFFVMHRNAACRENMACCTNSELWTTVSVLLRSAVSHGPQTSGNAHVFHHGCHREPCNDKQPCRLAKDGCFSMRVRACFRTCFHCVPVMEQGSCSDPHCCNLCFSDRSTGDVTCGRMLSRNDNRLPPPLISWRNVYAHYNEYPGVDVHFCPCCLLTLA